MAFSRWFLMREQTNWSALAGKWKAVVKPVVEFVRKF
jgi:hypothetical protein